MRNYIKLFFIICLSVPYMPMSASAGKEFNINDWDISVNAWLIGYLQYEHNDKSVPNGLDHSNTKMTFEDAQSRLFINFKNGPYKGLFEIRAMENVTGFDTVYYCWMEYDFNVGRILIGKIDPVTWDAILLPPPTKSGIAHMLGHNPAPMLRFTFPLGDTGAEFICAAVKPDDWIQTTNGGYIVDTAVEDDHKMPDFEARFNVPVGKFKFGFLGGYDFYTEKDADEKEYNIDAYMYGVCCRYFTGLNAHGGQTIYEATVYKDHNNYSHGGPPNQKGYSWIYSYADYTSSYYGDPRYDATTDSIIDTDFVGYALGVNHWFNDWFSVHTGVSQGWTEDDEGNKDRVIGYDFILNIKLTEILAVTPYFNVTDWMDRTPVGESSIDEGITTVVGTQFSFMF